MLRQIATLAAIAAIVLSGCQGLDVDPAASDRYAGSLMHLRVGGHQRVDRLGPDGGYEVNFSGAMGLSRVASLSAYETDAAMLDDSSRTLTLIELARTTRVSLAGLPAAPTQVVLSHDYALVLTANAQVWWVNRNPAFLMSSPLTLGFVPQQAVVHEGRLYLADTARYAVVEEAALAVRATGTFAALGTVEHLLVDALGIVHVQGSRGGGFAEVTIDNQNFEVLGSAADPTVRQQLPSPYFYARYADVYTQSVRLDTAGNTQPFQRSLLVAAPSTRVSALTFDFDRGEAFYTLGNVAGLYARRVTASEGPRLLTAASVQLLGGAYLWRRQL